MGALGALLVLVPRGGIFPVAGLVLLGGASGGLAWSLVGGDDLRLLVDEPRNMALLGVGVAFVIACAVPLARYPAVVPVALLAVAPFRLPVQLGEEEAFLLLPLYLAIASAVLALGYRILRGERPEPPPFLIALPLAAFVTLTATSFLWTWDERAGAIALAFFVFPFVAGFAVVARAPLADWLPRALLVTLVALGTLFAAIGIWQAHTRTLFFARDVEVANAYTSFFRVTSLFKDPSLYGRHLVIAIAVLLVAIFVRRGRTADWLIAAALVAFLFWGLFYSYSQSSFVALFAVTFAVAVAGSDRRTRVVLLACALVTALAAAGIAGAAIGDRSARDVTSGRSRLVQITLDAFEERPHRRCRHRRSAAGERRRVGPAHHQAQCVAHERADRARGARRHRVRRIPLAPRRCRVGARSRRAEPAGVRDRARGGRHRALRPFAPLRRLLRGPA